MFCLVQTIFGVFRQVVREGGRVGEPVAVETELGWVLSGPLKMHWDR